MFPVHIYEEGMVLPSEGNYYVVAGNGTWLHKDTGIVSGLVPVPCISFLDDLKAEQFVKCNLPKLPAKLVWKIETFFSRVWDKHQSEANTILFYNKDTKDFKVHVPVQSVNHSGVHYQIEACQQLPEMAGYLMVGTIHSHADFNAFHSGVDVHDEQNFDGLHVTFGNNNRTEFSISATIVMNGNRTLVDCMDVLEGIEPFKLDVADGRTGLYKLLPPTEDWSEGLDHWLSQVSRSTFFHRGDKVDWAGDLSTVSFREHCGVGPFEVEEVQGDKLLIKTKVGSAQFRRELFKVVEDFYDFKVEE